MENDDIRSRIYLKIPYSILDCGWTNSPNTFLVFIHLMLLANRKPHHYKDGVIDRGEVLASYEFLAGLTGLSVQNVRTAVKNLKKANMVSHRKIEGTNVFRIEKYMDYQSLGIKQNTFLTDAEEGENGVIQPFFDIQSEPCHEKRTGREHAENTYLTSV